MGKIIVLISTTPDGFSESKNVIIDPEFFEFTHSLLSSSTGVLFGRTTFEQFSSRWQERLKNKTAPDWQRKMAQLLNDIPKIVFSTTLKSPDWSNTRIMNKLDKDYVTDFRLNGSGALLTFGSLSIIEALTEMNAVDDYYFNVQPLIPGAGEARLFSKTNLAMPRPLKYINHKHLNSGAHILHYQTA